MKNIITAIALSVATATTASANICNVNPNAIIDYPGYHGIQKSWYDKGEYLFMFSAVSHHADPISYKTWNNVESIVTHYRLDKATCTMSEIEVVITENKERFEAPVVEEIIEEEIVDEDEIIVDGNVTTITRWAERLREVDYKSDGTTFVGLKVNRKFYTVTTVTDSSGNVISRNEVQDGLPLGSKFWSKKSKDGTYKRGDWGQDNSGSGDDKVFTTHNWKQVQDAKNADDIKSLLTNGYVKYTPSANQVKPNSWK